MAKMHVLEVDFARVSAVSEVLIRGERRPELDGLGRCHVAFYALTCGGSGDNSNLKGTPGRVFLFGMFGEFAENGLGNTVWSEPRKRNGLVVFDHGRSLGSRHSRVSHIVVSIDVNKDTTNFINIQTFFCFCIKVR